MTTRTRIHPKDDGRRIIARALSARNKELARAYNGLAKRLVTYQEYRRLLKDYFLWVDLWSLLMRNSAKQSEVNNG